MLLQSAHRLPNPLKSFDTIIASLVKATTPAESPEGKKPQSPYRFCVNCTIIQQDVDEEDKPGSAGKRGMHSAAGAYWDVSRDGMWTYKYQNAEDRGIEVVLNIAWFGTH
ncbi:dynein light chain [Ascosphaera apis ARSEF 7405]|uniref:Dynein light chain n=1 Tax=Ascosphaera apis ARSEF 7405 TaxID=392613 RepID=A0A162JJC7_9EURO|nr:dynein light chain [Ascosphaera apis ARSEF 7405]